MTDEVTTAEEIRTLEEDGRDVDGSRNAQTPHERVDHDGNPSGYFPLGCLPRTNKNKHAPGRRAAANTMVAASHYAKDLTECISINSNRCGE